MKWPEVPEWARSRRIDLGLTQAQVAEKAEALRHGAGGPKPIKQQQIGQLEKGMLKGEPDWFRFVKTVLEERPEAVQTDKQASADAELDQIARRLVLTRRAMDEMRPADLCRRTGIRPNTYSQWEGAKSRPRLDEARLLCRHFGYTLDWIYEGDPSGLPHKLATRIAELEADFEPEPTGQISRPAKPRRQDKHLKH